jgi:hypothetical protein
MKLKIENRHSVRGELARNLVFISTVAQNLEDAEARIAGNGQFKNFKVGHGGSHVWIVRKKDNERVAIITE